MGSRPWVVASAIISIVGHLWLGTSGSKNHVVSKETNTSLDPTPGNQVPEGRSAQSRTRLSLWGTKMKIIDVWTALLREFWGSKSVSQACSINMSLTWQAVFLAPVRSDACFSVSWLSSSAVTAFFVSEERGGQFVKVAPTWEMFTLGCSTNRADCKTTNLTDAWLCEKSTDWEEINQNISRRCSG